MIFSVTLRNYMVGRDRVLIAYQGGINFYLGNNPESDGHSATPVCNVRGIPDFYRHRHGTNLWIKDDVWLSGYYVAEMDRGRNLKPSETLVSLGNMKPMMVCPSWVAQVVPGRDKTTVLTTKKGYVATVDEPYHDVQAKLHGRPRGESS